MVIHNLSNGDAVYGPIIHTYGNFGKVNESADAMRTYLIKHPLYLKFWRHAQRNRIGISEQGGEDSVVRTMIAYGNGVNGNGAKALDGT